MVKKILVRIVKDWNYPDLKRQSLSNSGIWENITFTEEPIEHADYLICLNPPRKKITINCPIGNKWLFLQEPPLPHYRYFKNSFKYFDRVYGYEVNGNNIYHDQTSLPWHIGRNYQELKNLNKGRKMKKISWVTSNLSHTSGHKKRMDFLSYIQNCNININLYGRGIRSIKDKFDGLYPYKFSLAVENYSCEDYWTEKIADCYLSWTMPIYFGCKNITKYFPEKSFIAIDLNNFKKSVKIIQNAISGNMYEKNLKFIEIARNKILDEYQFYPHISKLIKEQDEAIKTHAKWIIPENANMSNKFLTLIRKLIYG